MAGNLTHEFELYPPETFRILLEHEVNRSRRYRNPLTLIHLAIEAEPNELTTQHSAEVFAINALNLQLRETDIPCKREDEFIILIPSLQMRRVAAWFASDWKICLASNLKRMTGYLLRWQYLSGCLPAREIPLFPATN